MEKDVKKLLKTYENQTENEEKESFDEAHCCGMNSGDCCDLCAIASCDVCCDTMCQG